MIIMGLDEEYEYALENFVKTLDFSKSNAPSKGFETSIRYLGGLLAAYDLKGDKILLDKAVELTERVLMPLFDPISGAPYTYFDVNGNRPVKTNTITLAEFGTYTVEFTRLSQLTGNMKYANVANAIVEKAIAQPSRMAGLYPNSWNVNPFKPLNASIVNVGAGGDSFYEYLIKNYVISEKPNKDILNAWVAAVNSIEDYLLSPTKEDPSIQFIASITNQTVNYQSDELICFWPGNILLGMSQMTGDKSRQQKFAQTFMDSCIKTWETTGTGLAPEVWSWNPKTPATQKTEDPNIWEHIKDIFNGSVLKRSSNNEQNGIPNKRDLSGRPFEIVGPSYNLRPETIESIFYYDRVVGGSSDYPDYYKDIGWRMFEKIQYYTKTDTGYSSIRDVDDISTGLGNKSDFQESFFFAETLKYLYLLFSDDSCMSLDHYVFSTEAHPFKMPRSIKLQK
ncbi:glycoside hydrolase [Phascolomyces articulosus]|uniref:alpha-1,2-Mannosidase n=1 Tax=Phascolomyces articulosus TaxID=60185 RepID=A0AAD5K1Z0_9FUNG|nr:glycoside hydrolase [Phascolomyces articulosus]